MRRSVREALVGFSLLAALASGFGFWLWLKGVSLSRNTWTIRASFADAAGLAERSPVSYRGVLVGNVRRITVSDKAVEAELEINDPRLRLSRPVAARVGASSLLGGDAMVSLLSAGPTARAAGPLGMPLKSGPVVGSSSRAGALRVPRARQGNSPRACALWASMAGQGDCPRAGPLRAS